MDAKTPRYPSGQDVRLGDRVRLRVADGTEVSGRVVFVIETQSYDDAYPAEQWAYLGTGVMVEFDDGLLVHYPSDLDELVLLEPGDADPGWPGRG